MANQRSTVQDTGYSWVILGSSCILGFLLSSLVAVGVYFIEFMEYFNTDSTDLAWIGACMFSMLGFAGFVAGPMAKSCSCRVVVIFAVSLQAVGCISSAFTDQLWGIYVAFGIIAGTGFGFYNVAGPVAINQYFDKRRSTAIGIFLTSSSVGTFIWPPLVEWLIQMYTWRGALLIQAGLYLNGFVAAGLLRPVSNPVGRSPAALAVDHSHKGPSEIGQESSQHRGVQEQRSENVSDSSVKHEPGEEPHGRPSKHWRVIFTSLLAVSVLRDPIFLLYCLGIFFQQMGHFGVNTYLPLRGVTVGATKQEAAFLLSVLGIGSGIGRLAVGALGDKAARYRALLSGFAATASGLLCLVSIFFKTYLLMVCFSAAFGLVSASYVVMLFTLVSDILGEDHVAKGTGTVMIFIGFCNLLLFPVSGRLIDYSGSAAHAFLLFGACLLCGGLLVTIVQCLLDRRRGRLKRLKRLKRLDEHHCS